MTIGATAVETAVERGMAAMPQVRSGEKMQAPKNTVGDERRRGGRGGPRGPRRGEEAPAPAAAPAAPAADAPPAT